MNLFDRLSSRPGLLLSGLAVVGLAIAPFWLSPYRQNIVIISMYYVIMAASWNQKIKLRIALEFSKKSDSKYSPFG